MSWHDEKMRTDPEYAAAYRRTFKGELEQLGVAVTALVNVLREAIRHDLKRLRRMVGL